jgi:hypothetical protein
MAWILLEEDEDDVAVAASRRSDRGREEKCRKEEVDSGGGWCSLGDANALVEREEDARTTRRRRHVTADHIIIVEVQLDGDNKFKVCVEAFSLG